MGQKDSHFQGLLLLLCIGLFLMSAFASTVVLWKHVYKVSQFSWEKCLTICIGFALILIDFIHCDNFMSGCALICLRNVHKWFLFVYLLSLHKIASWKWGWNAVIIEEKLSFMLLFAQFLVIIYFVCSFFLSHFLFLIGAYFTLCYKWQVYISYLSSLSFLYFWLSLFCHIHQALLLNLLASDMLPEHPYSMVDLKKYKNVIF